MVRACELTNCTPLIRIGHLQSHAVLQALDIGALGVHVPSVNTAEQVREAVILSFCLSTLSTRSRDIGVWQECVRPSTGCERLSDYCLQANKQTMVIIHCAGSR